jgi:hypothetical protein
MDVSLAADGPDNRNGPPEKPADRHEGSRLEEAKPLRAARTEDVPRHMVVRATRLL